jgi:hypothetical protein
MQNTSSYLATCRAYERNILAAIYVSNRSNATYPNNRHQSYFDGDITHNIH